MKTIEALFEFILNNDLTVVYGNLGRKSILVFDYLVKHLPTFEIRIKSKIYPFPTTRQIKNEENGKCDLLIYMEPDPDTVAILPPGVSRMVIFTSHLLLSHVTQHPIYVSYHHTDSNIREEIIKTKNILALQDSSVQSGKDLKNQINFLEVKTVGVNNCDVNIHNHVVISRKTFFIVDVSSTTSLLQLFLHVLDIIDYLKDNIDMVERWLICFPDNKIRRYEHFVQECINQLFCRQFQFGNVTCNAELLALSPFYKSGIIDNKFDCDVKYFCKLKYISPSTDTDAFQACIKYNLKPLTPQLFSI